jgi:hypothetical protein
VQDSDAHRRCDGVREHHADNAQLDQFWRVIDVLSDGQGLRSCAPGGDGLQFERVIPARFRMPGGTPISRHVA